MKKTLILFLITTSFLSCKNENQHIAKSNVKAYLAYVDSISKLSEDKVYENWETIEGKFQKFKSHASSSITKLDDGINLKNEMDSATLRYERFKANIRP